MTGTSCEPCYRINRKGWRDKEARKGGDINSYTQVESVFSQVSSTDSSPVGEPSQLSSTHFRTSLCAHPILAALAIAESETPSRGRSRPVKSMPQNVKKEDKSKKPAGNASGIQDSKSTRKGLKQKLSKGRLRRKWSEPNLRRHVSIPSDKELPNLPAPSSQFQTAGQSSQSQRSQTFPRPPTQNSTTNRELRQYFSDEQLSTHPASTLTRITSPVEPGVRLESKVDLSSSDDESKGDFGSAVNLVWGKVKKPFQKKKK